MAVSTLTVKLNNGHTLYFTAGAVLGDSANRIDLLRDAIENDTQFASPDLDGNDQSFLGSEVTNYHLA